MNTPINLDKDIPVDILSYLRELGLSDKEAIIYFTLLKVGEAGTSQISKETGLHSQFVYNSLDSLIGKGLVEKYTDKKRPRYSARDPKAFYERVEKDKNIINQLTVSVENNLISTIDSKSVGIYKGRDAFIKNEMSTIIDSPQDGDLLIIGGPGDEYINLFGPEFNEYEYHRNKKNLNVRYIGNEAQKKYLEESADKRKLFKYRYLPGQYGGVMNISIVKNLSVTIYLFQNPVSTIIIKNKKIIDGYAEFFETLWSMSKK
jgi:HTH-type transcriptional regulator, sugar sensing transcriptional regulator